MGFDGIEFYILCYNSFFCCDYQIKCINHFCKDKFKIIIFDSNLGINPTDSKQKESLCKEKNIEFITLPNKEVFNKSKAPSDILGYKLNCLYYDYILKREPKYFGIIDQDMFMIKPFSITERLDKYGMWGDIQEAANFPKSGDGMRKYDINDSPWVLHPWLSFYKLDYVRQYKLDFLPVGPIPVQFDTGGANYEAFIKHLTVNKEDYWFRENIIMYYPFHEISNAGPPPFQKHYFDYRGEKIYGQIQINNGFLHLLCSSKMSDGQLNPKIALCKGMLDGILLSNNIIFDKTNGYETFESPSNKI